MTAEEYVKQMNEVKETQYWSEELEKCVDDYCLYVRSQIGEGDTPYFEQRVDFSEWVPDGFGTADVIILNDHKVRVIDLKAGKGVAVDAADNPQLRIYALGGWYKYKEAHPNITEVEYTIHQPRLESITTETVTLDSLLDWAEHVVKPKAKKAYAGQGDFNPGEWCLFCKAKSQCRARSDFNDVAAAMDFKAPALLTDQELVTVLQRATKSRSWLKDVEQYLLDRATGENIVPQGYTLGQSKTNRKIVDTETAASKLSRFGDDIFEERSLKSVAQLEKLVGKNPLQEILGDLIVRPEGEPKLVPAKDDAKDDFS
jgi:hypothetical protein